MSTVDEGFKSSVCRLGRLESTGWDEGWSEGAPLKAFKRDLKRYAKRVVDIDKYLTSQTCSCRHGKVAKAVCAERKKKNNNNKQAKKTLIAFSRKQDEPHPIRTCITVTVKGIKNRML